MERVKTLINNSNNIEEITYLQEVLKQMKIHKIFLDDWLLVCVKCSCGHYEVLQFPNNDNLEELLTECKKHKCSGCVVEGK